MCSENPSTALLCKFEFSSIHSHCTSILLLLYPTNKYFLPTYHFIIVENYFNGNIIFLYEVVDNFLLIPADKSHMNILTTQCSNKHETFIFIWTIVFVSPVLSIEKRIKRFSFFRIPILQSIKYRDWGVIFTVKIHFRHINSVIDQLRIQSQVLNIMSAYVGREYFITGSQRKEASLKMKLLSLHF